MRWEVLYYECQVVHISSGINRNVDTEKLKTLHGQNLSSRQIAAQLGVSKPTVQHWFVKLGLAPNFPPPHRLDFVGKDKVRCRKCKNVLPLDEFKHKYQQLSYCKECHKKQKLDYRRRLNSNLDWYIRDKYNHLKARAKQAGILFSISLDDYRSQYEKQHGKCFYTDALMEWGTGKGKNSSTASLDKIVPEKGYVPGNVVFCTMKANMVKQNLTLQEVELWLPGWYDRLKNHWADQEVRHATI